MNSLSWLIYLAEIVRSLDLTLDFVRNWSMVVAAGCAVGGAFSLMAEVEKYSIVCWQWFKRILLYIVLPIILLDVFIPTKQTVMMIAASEFGEEIATSAEAKNIGGKAYQSLDKFLSSYLEEERNE